MAETQDQHYIDNFEAGILELQQQGASKTEGTYRNVEMRGEQTYVNRIAALDDSDEGLEDERYGKTNLIEATHSRRRLVATPRSKAIPLDDNDSVRMLEDPSNAYSSAISKWFARKKDEVRLAQWVGTAYSGKAGATSVSLGASQQVIVNLSGSSEGLTLDKLIEAQNIFGENNFDEDETKHLALRRQQISDLLKIEKATSGDYVTIRALESGNIDEYMGFMMHRTQKCPHVTATDVASAVAWVQDSVAYGEYSQNMKTRVTERDDLRYVTQIYHREDFGATRLQEEGVVEIFCDESP